ncbi:MAG: ribonuclease P protein component [Bacteroidales bacterium]|nr:ribonuclease P protein component [Bacteroidales bacterium]
MYTFGKHERLCAGRLIESLHESGHRLVSFPFVIRWMTCQANDFASPAQVLIVAPKRKLHHAVDRNRAKRLMRECYRLHKPELYTFLDQHNAKVAIALNYIHTDLLPYDSMNRKYERALASLEQDIAQCLASKL